MKKMQSRYENELRDQERNYLVKLRDLESKVQTLSSIGSSIQ